MELSMKSEKLLTMEAVQGESTSINSFITVRFKKVGQKTGF